MPCSEVYEDHGFHRRKPLNRVMPCSEVCDDEIRDLRKELCAHFPASDSVEASRIEGRLELLPLVDECVDHAHRVLPVDVIIRRAVDLKEPAGELVRMLEGSALLVSVGVLLRRKHVALGI